METRKLFYEDCHLKEFTATVLHCEPQEKGWQVVLDATAFYPEGGGQACDLGTLEGVAVLDVREQGEEIVHLCSAPLTPGSRVRGVLNWDRRFALMQQHTGEHIVSGIIHKRYGYHNVGFHMGSEIITIDFDGPVPQEDLASIEEEANRKIWENVSVRCWYPAEAELPQIPYRTKRALPWPVRIVEVPGADLCACCGVHVVRTGEIGMVKLLSAVKFHQGVRIEMACGVKALGYLSRIWEQNRQVSQAFSAKPMETGAAAKKMNEALAAEKYKVTALQRRLFDLTAANYAGQALAVHFEEGLAPAGVRELAERIAAVCTGPAVVFSGTDENYDVCLARPGGDVKELGQSMAKALNGRGGGKNGFFQGSVRATKEQILGFFGIENQ